MSCTGIKVHHLSCACIQRLTILGQPLSCHVLLVETPSSGLVLVDTGLGTADYHNMSARLGYMFAYGYAKPKRDSRFAVVNQIQALGYNPSDVKHIVMTHLDLDHVGGLADFPNSKIHVHSTEFHAAMERKSFKARCRYRPVMWAHEPNFQQYSEQGERWFGFEAVRELRGLPPEILLVPLFGHTLGHSGVAIQSQEGWLLHAGDAYFDAREINSPIRKCAWKVGLFQFIVTTNRKMRFYNQDRLRQLKVQHPEIQVFCAHNPFELPGFCGK